MSAKAYIYIIVALIVIWALDSVNINAIFKKIKEYRYGNKTVHMSKVRMRKL